MSDSKPLRLHDGTLVYKDGRVVKPLPEKRPVATEQLIEVPTHREAQQLVVQTRKKLSDLPEVPKTMNAVSAVLAYSLFGLDDDEIALAIGVSPDRVASIRQLDAFGTMRNDIMANILSAEQDDIRNLFVQHARSAAGAVADVMARGKPSDRLKAAADILDRSGFRPADVIEHRHKLEGELTIEVVRKEQHPIIDLDIDKE